LEKGNFNTTTEEKGFFFEYDIIKRFSLIFFAKTVSEAIFFIVSNILLINWLSIESVHDYIIFLTIVNFIFSLILTFHIAMPKFLQKDSSELRRGYLFNGMFMLVVNFIILVLFFLILTFGFNFDYNVFYPNYEFLFIFLLGALVYELFRFFESVLYGLKLSKKIAVIYLFLSFFFLLISINLVIFFKLGFIGAVLSYIISYFLLDCISFYFIYIGLNGEKTQNQKNKNKNENKRLLNKVIQKDLILFCLPIFTSNLFYFLNTRFGTLMLSGLNDGSSEIFHLSLTLSIYLIALLGVTVNELLFPYESAAFYHNNQKKIKEIYKLIFTFVAVIIIPLLLVCITASNLILGIIYPAYFTSYPVFVDIFQLMLIGGFFYSLNQFTAKFLLAKGLTIRFLIIQIIGGSLNALFLIIFIPLIGVYSAIWGFIISMGVMFILYFYSISRIINLSLWQFKLLQLFISILIVIFEFFILKFGFGIDNFLVGTACLLSYIILLFGFRILKFKELIKFFNDLRIMIFKSKKV